MTGASSTYDYKSMAAQIVATGGEGMGNLLPVVEKELLHYRILDVMMREGFFSSLVFQGGTSLRLCHGSPRYSEDLDFAGGTSFDMDALKGLGSCRSDGVHGRIPALVLMGDRTDRDVVRALTELEIA